MRDLKEVIKNMENLTELIKMPVIEERKVTKAGSSLVITLPNEWSEENGIKAGDTVLVRANGHIEIRVKSPENIEQLNKEILTIRNISNNIASGAIVLDQTSLNQTQFNAAIAAEVSGDKKFGN